MPLVRFFVCVVLIVSSSFAYSETISKGVGEITYKGWGLSAEDRREAEELAVMSAIARWASGEGSHFLKNFDLIKPTINKNVDEYVLAKSVVTENQNEDSRTYQVVLKVTIDDVKIHNLVTDSSAVANVSEEDKSYMTFIFVSRRQASVQSFDEKVYKRVDQTKSEAGNEEEQISSNGVEYSSKTNNSLSVTAGGSSTQKSDVIRYDVASAEEINMAMSEVFSSSGFEIVEAEYLEEETEGLISVDAFKDDYRTGNDISGSNKRSAAKGAKMVEVPYFAMGTLDIGVKQTDSATGLVRVSVTVTGKILSVKKRFPKTIASVGPIAIAGLGPSQSEAERNALKIAANQAAKELVNQLNAKGIR